MEAAPARAGGRLGVRLQGIVGLGVMGRGRLRIRHGGGRLVHLGGGGHLGRGGRLRYGRFGRRRSLVRFADGGAERLLLLASQVGGVTTPLALQLEVLSNRFVEESHRASTDYSIAGAVFLAAGSARSVRFLPARLARYSAASAVAMRSSLPAAVSGTAATPKLAVTLMTP